MRSYLKIAAALALVALIAVITYQYIRIKRLIDKGHKLSQSAQAFERIDPQADFSMLVIGDSGAFGVGAATPGESIIGKFGTAHPTISLENRGHNGDRVADLLETFQPASAAPGKTTQRYDLLLIQIGGNDVTHFTNLQQLEKDLGTLLDRAKMVSDHVYVLTSGDFVTAPLFPWPINYLFSWRYHRVRDLFLKTVPAHGATYVDIFSYEESHPVSGRDWDFYAADGFHPNGPGYQPWFEALEFTLKQSGFSVPR
ncbi:MAG: GDSL-type esterase/lipase family protein [Candidatus Andersenbacteria bacterium]